MLFNYKFKYIRKGKRIFVPNDKCVRKGDVIIRFCRDRVTFPDSFYHYKKGGHISALHDHMRNQYFFRIDLQNFFYAIGRNRVTSALYDVGFPQARTYAKWSCVRNPFVGPSYALPIGFVQSPALASLVLARSPLMATVDAAKVGGVFTSVYLDDFICSAPDIVVLRQAYDELLAACVAGNLAPNPKKLVPPATEIVAFNCVLKCGFAAVTIDRVGEFFSEARSIASTASFNAYRTKVSEKN